MRNAILLLALLVIGCSKTVDDPKPTFSSIEGKWSFVTTTSGGGFTISKESGNLMVTEGWYVIDDVNGTSHKYTVGNKWIVFTPVTGISLIDSNGGNGYNSLSIEVSSVSDDYTVIKASRLTGYHGSFVYSFTNAVEIKRTQ